MADSLTAERRSWNMSRIKNKDTKIEVMVRRWLFAKGYRFRKNDNRYPGKPDVVLPKYKTVIFVNGCFWHQHDGCKSATIPKTRTEFWVEKLNRNKEKDNDNIKRLESIGWNVITLWECELNKSFDQRMELVDKELKHILLEDEKNEK